jgi:two-component system, chemotaxis family, chemotaxis protein CheY
MRGRVLIVDDVADIRVMLRYMMEKEDYEIVAEAANGVEAVEKYRQYLPDITIMDIEMPYKTGVEAAREIRELSSDARIIFCSGCITKSNDFQELGLEGHAVIAKPFLPADLYRALAG